MPALVIVLLGAAAIAFALSSGGGTQGVRLSDVDGANARDTAEALVRLVDDNTR